MPQVFLAHVLLPGTVVETSQQDLLCINSLSFPVSESMDLNFDRIMTFSNAIVKGM
ncbi:hypothetical protein SLU01_26880 [Sporosarcina luteola]|uniref:Uncharacterized protein n=1 Tax=Sporosarcina luteola TaxID=582850 RepID=A0A511ZA90_9BACL|nr:hypothetical protein SLU01_26880 [Sporosarcina luteola]